MSLDNFSRRRGGEYQVSTNDTVPLFSDNMHPPTYPTKRLGGEVFCKSFNPVGDKSSLHTGLQVGNRRALVWEATCGALTFRHMCIPDHGTFVWQVGNRQFRFLWAGVFSAASILGAKTTQTYCYGPDSTAGRHTLESIPPAPPPVFSGARQMQVPLPNKRSTCTCLRLVLNTEPSFRACPQLANRSKIGPCSQQCTSRSSFSQQKSEKNKADGVLHPVRRPPFDDKRAKPLAHKFTPVISLFPSNISCADTTSDESAHDRFCSLVSTYAFSNTVQNCPLR